MKSIKLPAGTTHVPFDELAHLIADALWPEGGPDDGRIRYGAARVNLDAELALAVKSGALMVKDPLTLGPHTFPYGDALSRAVVRVEDLRAFIAGRGLSILFQFTVDEDGGTTTYLCTQEEHDAREAERNHRQQVRQSRGFFTLHEVAEVLSTANGLVADDFLNDRLRPAVESGDLVLLDPIDQGPVTGRPCRIGDWVTPANVNKWLKAAGFPYSWPQRKSGGYGRDECASEDPQSLIVRIADREAMPVRALPLATGDRLSPDQVVKQLARVASKDFPHLKTTHAYYLAGGVPKRMLPHEWDRFLAKVNALEAELRAKYPDAPGKDHRGYGEWLERATSVLPAGVFVWLDEFQQDYEAEFSPEHESIANERDGERALNVSPFLEPETRNIVMAGFTQQPGQAANQSAAYVPASTPAVATSGAEKEARPPPTVREHKVRNRSDPLAAVIKAAKDAAVNGEDYHSVWAALVKMAETDPPAPVVGYVPGEGVQYKVDDDGEELRYFKKDALRKRMNPSARGG